jgi:hypothetical protein
VASGFGLALAAALLGLGERAKGSGGQVAAGRGGAVGW